jgi:predicted metal-dependent hydrolase
MKPEYNIVYSSRKTVGLTVERDSSVTVRAPHGSDPEKLRMLVEKKALWIYEKQRHPQKYGRDYDGKEFVSGESVLYLGRNYRLEINRTGAPGVRLTGKFIVCGPSNSDFKDMFRQWFIEKAGQRIPERVDYYARHMGSPFNRVMVSDLRFRWGSCTPKNNLNFNWRLIKAPMHVVDYVVVHELAHLLESNHTPRFWQLVKTQLPQYEVAKEWLKENGRCLESKF